jgi:hypothetical protein
VLHRLPQQALVDLVGRVQRVSQLNRAYLLSVQIQYIHVCHRLLLLPDTLSGSQSQLLKYSPERPKARLPHRRYYFLFAVAFFEAFSGSTVPDPANPRRSRGGVLAFEIST